MATTIEKVQQLIQEIGPSMQDIDAVVQTEEPSWAIQFSDETIIIIEAIEGPERMVMSAEIGSADDAIQKPVYETMLCYNMMWRESGGVKIGLAGPKGALILSSDLCLEGLTLMDLQESMKRFVKIVRSWKNYVQHSETAAAPLPGLSGNDFHLHA